MKGSDISSHFFHEAKHKATGGVGQINVMRATLLHDAARDQNTELTKQLLDAKADPWCRNVLKQTPLHLAASGKSTVAAREIILLLTTYSCSAFIDAVYCPGPTMQYTAFFLAAYYNNAEAAELLLELNADINQHPQNKFRPIHYAAIHQNKSLTWRLYASNAETDVSGFSLLGGKKKEYETATKAIRSYVTQFNATIAEGLSSALDKDTTGIVLGYCGKI